jgi:hypothetical protein
MPVFDDMKFEHQEFAIGGKLVTGSIIVKEYEYQDPIAVQKVIKEKLLERLVNHIIENKLAEFTMVKNPIEDSRIYRVRCYLAPDHTVKILRTLKQNQLQL